MTFDDLAAGQSVFLDANTLVYHFEPHPDFGPACNQLISRVERQDVSAFTSTHILTEVAHRLMMIEAAALPGWTPSKVRQRVQGHPAAVQGLSRFRAAVESVVNSRIQILSIAPPLIVAACRVSQQTGLLSNAALLVAVMQANNLSHSPATTRTSTACRG
jgi:predicted nucleic acid-binding protein